MKTNKGQVAVEYLMNYGWALLALAIVVAAIYATGAFTPNYFVMEECSLDPTFRCVSAFEPTAANPIPGSSTQMRVLMNITNTAGYPIYLKCLNFTSDEDGQVVTNTPSCPNIRLNNTDSILIGLGGSGVNVNVAGAVQPGTSKKLLVSVTYDICAEEVSKTCPPQPGAGYTKTISGRVVNRISEIA